MNPVIHGGKRICMIRILLIDWDLVMKWYKIYNLPICNHNIAKSLQYVLEGTNLAISKDNKYAAILSDTGIHSVYFGRQTFLHLEYWSLPHWHKSMVYECPVLQRWWQDWHLLQTYPFQYHWTTGQLPWPGPVGHLCWRACTYRSQMWRPQPGQNLRTPIHSHQPATSVQHFLFYN